jgi:hypothetical protein
MDYAEYHLNPVFTTIYNRFHRFFPPILLREHIEEVTEIGRTVSEGFFFKPKSSLGFRMDVASTKLDKYSGVRAFHWDDRKVWVHKLAALATDGEGYREIGQPSLHIAIGKDICNVHLDEFGFIGIDANGFAFVGPEAGRHIGDELIWRAYPRRWITQLLTELPLNVGEAAAKLFDMTYVVLPGASNRYERRVGVGVNVPLKRSLKLRFEYTCGNYNCTDNRFMVNLTTE